MVDLPPHYKINILSQYMSAVTLTAMSAAGLQTLPLSAPLPAYSTYHCVPVVVDKLNVPSE